MRAVIIGGNECMQRRSMDVCRKYACGAKVFARKTGSTAHRLGSADLIFLCMDTVSHTMAQNAAREAFAVRGFQRALFTASVREGRVFPELGGQPPWGGCPWIIRCDRDPAAHALRARGSFET